MNAPTIYRETIERIADSDDWQDERALLARVLCFADSDMPISRGLRADIEAHLGLGDPDTP